MERANGRAGHTWKFSTMAGSAISKCSLLNPKETRRMVLPFVASLRKTLSLASFLIGTYTD